MTNRNLIWTLLTALPIGIAAVGTGYYYNTTGHLPFQRPTETVSGSTTSSESGTGGTAPSETVAAPDTKTEAAEAPAAAKGDKQGDPSFDVVGVEPTGETVVAGRSDAGAIVALTANGKVVGKSIANEVGEWTIILDEPLKPGDYDVGLEVHDEKGDALKKSGQHLAVSIPQDGKEKPLVVLNTPDAPSDILQMPETAETQVAAAPAQPEAQAESQQQPQAPAEQAAAPAAGQEAPAPEQGAAEVATAAPTEESTPAETGQAATETAAQSTEPASEETQQAVAPAAEPAATETAAASAEKPAGEVASTAPAAPAGSEQVAAAQETAEPTAPAEPTAGETAPADSATGETQIAALPTDAQAAADNSAAPVSDTAGTPEPASQETAASTDAQQQPGTSEPEASQPAEIAAATAESQTAPAAGASTGTADEHQVAAQSKTDTAAAGTATEPAGTVSETAAASPNGTSAPAQADPAAPEATTETAASEPAAPGTEASPSAGEQPKAPSVTVEAVESEPDKVYVAGTGKPGSSVRVYVGDEYQGEAKVNETGRWLVEGSKNVPAGDVEVRADQIAKDGNAVAARAAVTFQKQEDQQIVLTKVVAVGQGAGADGQDASVQQALPVVIIRKGDNLWQISRRLYGQGIRYTTIYQANQQQIRNPDLIYPGQVFLTPEGDLNWKPGPAERG